MLFTRCTLGRTLLRAAIRTNGCEVAAVRFVLASTLGMNKGGATHIAVATDHVFESFRDELWPDYKTGIGIDSDLLAQFPLLEKTLSAGVVVVWPMVRVEADDVLVSAAMAAARDARVEFAHRIRTKPNACAARASLLNRRTRVRRPSGVDPRLSCAGRRRGRPLRLRWDRAVLPKNFTDAIDGDCFHGSAFRCGRCGLEHRVVYGFLGRLQRRFE